MYVCKKRWCRWAVRPFTIKLTQLAVFIQVFGRHQQDQNTTNGKRITRKWPLDLSSTANEVRAFRRVFLFDVFDFIRVEKHIKAAGDKLLINKFIRQNFREGLTLKNFISWTFGSWFLWNFTESLGNGGSATSLFLFWQIALLCDAISSQS